MKHHFDWILETEEEIWDILYIGLGGMIGSDSRGNDDGRIGFERKLQRKLGFIPSSSDLESYNGVYPEFIGIRTEMKFVGLSTNLMDISWGQGRGG